MPSTVGPTNGTGCFPDGATPSVFGPPAAGGVLGTYGLLVTGWVTTVGAVDPSA